MHGKRGGPTGVIGKLAASVFLVAFAGFGVAFMVLAGGDMLGPLATYAWEATPCEIVSSEVREDQSNNAPFEFVVEYTYSYDGRQYTAQRYRADESQFDDYTKVQRLAERYPAGGQATCYVDSDEPSEAVLQRGPAWIALFMLIPAVFVLIGVGGLIGVWFGKSDADSKPIVSREAKGRGRLFAVLFFGIFAAVGLGMSWFLLVKPLVKVVDARSWRAVECTVESSRVRSHRDSDGTTYSVDILYRYTFDGREYKSNRYDFIGGSSGGSSGKHEIVSQYPEGRTATCYINPDDPSEAVLNRGLSWMFLLGLIPLVFLAVGVGGIYFTLRSKDDSKATVISRGKAKPHRLSDTAGAAALDFLPDYDTSDGPVTLKPTMSRWLKLAGVLVFALVWNGIISVFLFEVYESHAEGDPDWFLTLFMIPFVLVGLGTIAGVVYFALALTNPKPQVTVNTAALPLGGALDVAWDLVGNVNKVRRLHVWLEAREEATYRRGTNTYTDKETIATFDLLDSQDRRDIAHGAGSVTIPADAMHSFTADNNKIVWSLKMEGDIPRWPNVKAAFEIVVLPIDHDTEPAA